MAIWDDKDYLKVQFSCVPIVPLLQCGVLGFRVDEILGPVRVEEICPRYPSTPNPKTGSFVGSFRREDPISFWKP